MAERKRVGGRYNQYLRGDTPLQDTPTTSKRKILKEGNNTVAEHEPMDIVDPQPNYMYMQFESDGGSESDLDCANNFRSEEEVENDRCDLQEESGQDELTSPENNLGNILFYFYFKKN